MRRIILCSLCVCFALLVTSPAAGVGLVTSDPDLPPDGVYVSPLEYHEYSAIGVVLDDPMHWPLTGTAIRIPLGPDEHETFDSVFSAVEIGMGLGPIVLTGPVSVVTFGKVGNTTGTFATEIVSMHLMGGGMMVQQDPYRPSLGITTITDLGGGLYHIDSFFDIFTEISPDGGASWFPSDYSTHMYLVPEPATLLLLGIGGLFLRKRRA